MVGGFAALIQLPVREYPAVDPPVIKKASGPLGASRSRREAVGVGGARNHHKALERRSQPAGTFSGGEQQMLAIGRAMMSRPKLLMLDEPSMGLSPLMMQRIMSTITELQSEGVTILLVEQNAQAALSLADYGYVLEVGKIVLQDTGPKLLTDDNVRKAYLGED